MSEPVLEVSDLVKHYAAGERGSVVRAVDGVSLTIGQGEVLGLVGESGSGKSTVGKCVLRLTQPTAGRIRLAGRDITRMSRRGLRSLRRDVHIVFQDPYSSLNPRFTVGRIVAEPLLRHGIARRSAAADRVTAMLGKVGLGPETRDRYPHELSGGQRQRVGLARSLILEPKLVVADEPVSALDVSVQASVLNLIGRLQADLGFACLFITHDLSIVEYFCDRVIVMYLGRIVESGTREQIFTSPQHPYTQALLSAALAPDPEQQRGRRRITLDGDMPSPIDPPSGCAFRTRCPLAHESLPKSEEEVPELRDVDGDGHLVACHLARRGRGVPRLGERVSPSTDRVAGG
jgi:oligopeptide transport system ATP-binding protein